MRVVFKNTVACFLQFPDIVLFPHLSGPPLPLPLLSQSCLILILRPEASSQCVATSWNGALADQFPECIRARLCWPLQTVPWAPGTQPLRGLGETPPVLLLVLRLTLLTFLLAPLGFSSLQFCQESCLFLCFLPHRCCKYVAVICSHLLVLGFVGISCHLVLQNVVPGF